MSVMRCPQCGSHDVECHPKGRGRPHMHECHACGYDGTTPLGGFDTRLNATESARAASTVEIGERSQPTKDQT